MNVYAEVVFPLPITHSFSYSVPPALRERARLGVRVTAPLGRRQLTGFLVHLRTRPAAGPATLKEIKDILDKAPLFSPDFLAFTHRLSVYFFSSWGEMLQAALPASVIPRVQELVSLTPAGREAMDKSTLSGSEKTLAALLVDKASSRFSLRRRVGERGFSSLLTRMEQKGLLEVRRGQAATRRRRSRAEEEAEERSTQLPLDFSFGPQAQEAAAALRNRLRDSRFSLSYLCGPAAEREAVYFDLIRTVLAGGGRTLFLVPEISPSAALRSRFQQKLGEKAVVFHSRLTEKQREEEERRVQAGQASVIIGPRSALLVPIPGLRLLIVDEEQDESLLQSESPAFDARQGLIFRAQSAHAAAVLGSAFPSVSWYHRAESEGFLVKIGSQPLQPQSKVVPMTRGKGLLSPELENRIRSRLNSGALTLIFLNRKGYTAWLVCPRCRFIPKCLHCDIPLTYHKRENRLACRYCRYEIPAIVRCPRCGEGLQAGREPGIEALEEEVRRRFPGSRVACFDTDQAGRRRDRARVVEEAARGQIDILLGTQLLAHQDGLPAASLVGILNPEAPLSLADFQAGQKAFQGLVRMMRSASAGSGPPAEVLIQTAMPDHHSIRCAAAWDFAGFYREEITFRRLLNYPPFSCVAEILFQGRNLRALARQVREFHERLRAAAPGIEVLGPGRAPVFRVRGWNRVHLLLRAKKKERLDAALKEEVSGRAAPLKAVWLYD